MPAARNIRIGSGSGVPAGPSFIKAASANGHHFVDAAGAPILVKGDTLWAAWVNLPTTDWETLCASRAGHGFNFIMVDLISCANQGGRDDTSTYDGVVPFTGGNLNTPNETYWSRIDTMLSIAESHGVTMGLYPMDYYSMGSGQFFFGKSTADCQAYGTFLGNRYKNRPNIVWVFGNDYQSESTTVDNQYDACLTGWKNAGDTHLVSMQGKFHMSLTTDWAFWAARADFNCVYTYEVQYHLCKVGYDYTPTMPAVMWEAAYIGEAYTGGDVPLTVRKQIGWSLTQGSPGEVMGTQHWRCNDTGWSTNLNETVMVGCTNMRSVFEAVAWWTLVPSTTFITSGAGTRVVPAAESGVGSPDWPAASDYASAAVSADGKLAMAYVPTQRAITVNTAVLGTSPVGTWIHPTTLATTAAGSLAGSNTPPAAGDWLLKITAS
jgi:hypothetical protein